MTESRTILPDDIQYPDKERYSVPLVERCAELYALGYPNLEIWEMVQAEFEDLTLNTIGKDRINNLIEQHKDFFESRKMQLSQHCADEVRLVHRDLFQRFYKRELKLVEVYDEKLDVCLEELRGLDMFEKDKDGNFINTSKFFVLTEQIEKLHTKASKIAGTDAMREIEVMKQKFEIKAQYDTKGNTGLVPGYTDPGASSSMRQVTPTKIH